jgi:hypothetical protein
MTKNSKYIIGTGTLILLVSILLPSRLTSQGFETIIYFAKSNQIGFTPYILLLFPVALGLALTKNLKTAFAVSTILILTNTTLFEDFLYNFFHIADLTFLRLLPFLAYATIFVITFYIMIRKANWTWYGAFICLQIISYLWVNDGNCTINFISDMGIQTYDLRVWFQNCGSYYAWWTAPILLNIGLFNELNKLDFQAASFRV